MKFIDEARIIVQAGRGGPGVVHWRREKFIPEGGPDGGDGGRGGSVIVLADQNTHTLLDLHFQPKWQAENGCPGEGRNRSGKSGEDIILKVPLGTVILDEQTGKPIADLLTHGTQFVLARGGRGGRGNTFFKSPTNRAPTHAQPGEEGEAGKYILSLKLVADVALVGFPNAGKSTFISAISAARPKVADYPFTTLIPNLGVVKPRNDKPFVVADIPGLIEGAHQGRGLGIKFLKHIERARVLAMLIDPLQIDDQGEAVPVAKSYQILADELRHFSEALADKPRLVLLTKLDAIGDREALAQACAELPDRNLEIVPVSSISGEGVDTAISSLSRMIKEHSAAEIPSIPPSAEEPGD